MVRAVIAAEGEPLSSKVKYCSSLDRHQVQQAAPACAGLCAGPSGCTRPRKIVVIVGSLLPVSLMSNLGGRYLDSTKRSNELQYLTLELRGSPPAAITALTMAVAP